ncbi:MAG: hypothetical protein NC204_05650 [Candidatus Amulumruptor caecigallinarius]|nr:hypothetical protein [Candidatus Amulumruptor caecigallinarius]
MASVKMSVRIPQREHHELNAIARDAGYASACQLARSILIQFLRQRDRVREQLTCNAAWIDDFIEEDTTPMTARTRDAIKHRTS